MQSHSEEAQFFCSISGCQAKFKAKPALKYHLSKHHISELKSMSKSLGSQHALNPKTKSREILAKTEYSHYQSCDSWTEEELGPNPTKFLFIEGAETRSNSSTRSIRTLRQELAKNCQDEELRELISAWKYLMKENKELKSKLADQLASFHKTDTYFNCFSD